VIREAAFATSHFDEAVTRNHPGGCDARPRAAGRV